MASPPTVGNTLIVGDFIVGADEEAAPPVRPTTSTQTLDVSIRAEVLDGTWETFGVDRAIEVLPETVVLSSNEWGPDKASFVLRRSPWVAWPDLKPYTPVEIEIGGVLVWEGRTGSTPLKAGAEQQISVQCEGWQYHLDDDLYKHLYVHATLTDWKDMRGSAEANLARLSANGVVQAEAGVLTLEFPKGTVAVTDNNIVGAYLDLGEASGRTVSVTFGATTFAGGNNWKLYIVSAPTVAGLLTTGELAYEVEPNVPVSGSWTFATPNRYIGIAIAYVGIGGTTGGDEYLKMPAITVYGAAGYEASNESQLKASTVIENALAEATKLLSADLSQINTGEDLFSIPALVMASYRTPREMIEAVNAFHDWITKLDLSRRMVFQPRPTEALLEVGSWSGEEIEDTSAGEAAEIYDRVVVEGTEADGSPLTIIVSQEGNVVSERGFNHTKAIPVSNVMTQAMGEKLGEVFLDSHQKTPFAGSTRANVDSVRQVVSGQPVHPSLLLRHPQELIRVSHMIDPNTGGVGRDGLIVAVTYTHATQMAEITLNNRLDNFESLLSRLAVIEEVGS